MKANPMTDEVNITVAKPESEAGLAATICSPTWPHVLKFAERMEAKLAKNRHKGDRNGWLKDSPMALWNRLDQEMCELLGALKDEDATFEQIANEAADVANFAMMIADVVTSRKSGNAPGQP